MSSSRLPSVMQFLCACFTSLSDWERPSVGFQARSQLSSTWATTCRSSPAVPSPSIQAPLRGWTQGLILGEGTFVRCVAQRSVRCGRTSDALSRCGRAARGLDAERRVEVVEYLRRRLRERQDRQRRLPVDASDCSVARGVASEPSRAQGEFLHTMIARGRSLW